VFLLWLLIIEYWDLFACPPKLQRRRVSCFLVIGHFYFLNSLPH